MARKRYKAEEIIGMLREAEVALAQGETVGIVCRRLGVSEQRFYRWRRKTHEGTSDTYSTQSFSEMLVSGAGEDDRTPMPNSRFNRR